MQPSVAIQPDAFQNRSRDVRATTQINPQITNVAVLFFISSIAFVPLAGNKAMLRPNGRAFIFFSL
jgi:hypothetical protein